MTAASPPPLTTPGGRVLLGWWRDLAGWQPHRLGVSQLDVQRVEALVGVTSPQNLDPLQAAYLEALVHAPGTHDSRLGPALEAALLGDLAAQGLIERNGTSWTPTDAGKAWVLPGASVRLACERRVFHFALGLAGGREPRYLPLTPDLAGSAGAPSLAGQFDPVRLEACVRQPLAWKARFGFPGEVEEVYGGAKGGGPVSDPTRVMLVSQYRVLLALVEVTGEAGQSALRGFAVHPDGLRLEAEAPVLALGEGWRELFPELAEPQ